MKDEEHTSRERIEKKQDTANPDIIRYSAAILFHLLSTIQKGRHAERRDPYNRNKASYS
jgi:hypothetical protein